MIDTHTGGCHCGQLRYTFHAPLQDIAHCHCSICRRTSGGIVTTWLTVPLASLHWTQGAPVTYRSSPGCVRYFCGRCGCHLTLHTQLSPDSLDITVASLDHPELAPAERHIWMKNRLPWLHLDPQLPQEDEEFIPCS